MDRTILDKEKLDLRSFEKLIHYQESQFINCIVVQEASAASSSPSMPKSNEKRAVIEAPKKKLKSLRTKSVLRHTYTNFHELAR